MVDILSSKGIYSFMNPEIKDKVSLEVLKKTDSTNTVLRSRANEGENEGLVIVAGEQTAGRGRMGRSFFSPGDTGVYMSLLLKPQIKPEDAVQITTAAAVSVCKALEKLGINDGRIKWVNDIFLGNKKVCGILTESSFNAKNRKLDYAILGVGINMYQPTNGFPEELENIAGAVFYQEKENARNKFVAYFLEAFFDFYNQLSKKRHLKEYTEKNFVIGKKVTVVSSEPNLIGTAIGIDDNCNLEIEVENGKVIQLNSGEISVKIV